MTNSLMQWHLARDNQLKLAKFCDKHQVDRTVSGYYKEPGTKHNYFTMTTYFDNGSFITAELIQGTEDEPKGIDDSYQVLDYGWGK